MSSQAFYSQRGKHEVLREYFGFNSFRPNQELVIDTLNRGGNVLAVMPTGSGKSLCYQIPALMNAGLTVVVSPLIALMRDQVSALKMAGACAETVNSSIEPSARRGVWDRLNNGSLKILYLSPEYLMTDMVLDALDKQDLTLIAVDEAHCISQWGPAFRPDYAELAKLHKRYPETPILATTATADEVTRTDILKRLFSGNAVVHVQGFDRPNIKLSAAPKDGSNRQLLKFLESHQDNTGIVYCLTRKKTETVSDFLQSQGYRTLTYHAGMDSEARDQNQGIFMTEPAVVMVATNAFGMGIDKSDIRFVLHADMPGSIESYYQEIGRAGRDGRFSEAHILFGLDDIRMRRMFIEQEGSDQDRERREYQRLNAFIGYCETPTCRRRALLAYFGEQMDGCENCDNCLFPVKLEDGTEYARMALSAIVRTRQRYGAMHIADVLMGKQTKKVLTACHDKIPTFGVGKDLPEQEWRAVLRQLVSSGFLTQNISGFGELQVTETGKSLLRGIGLFKYRKPAKSSRQSKTQREKRLLTENSLSSDDLLLLGRLKELRLRLAKEKQVPAFVIFHDKSLEIMAQKRPKTRVEFSRINGVGAAKLQAYADVFLAEIEQY